MGNLWNKASDAGDWITTNFSNPLATALGRNHDSSNWLDHMNYKLSNPLKNAVQPAVHDAGNAAHQTSQWLGLSPQDPAPAPTMPADFLKYTGPVSGGRPGTGYTDGTYNAGATNGLAQPGAPNSTLPVAQTTQAPQLYQQPNWAAILGRALQ